MKTIKSYAIRWRLGDNNQSARTTPLDVTFIDIGKMNAEEQYDTIREALCFSRGYNYIEENIVILGIFPL